LRPQDHPSEHLLVMAKSKQALLDAGAEVFARHG
jgi:hypothetical protein